MNFLFLKKNKIKKVIFSFFILMVFIFNFTIVDASLVPGSVNPPETGKYAKGDYELNDVLQVGLNVTYWILGIVGSLALLFFVYGGVMFLISAGNEQRVTQAKTIITNAVIGLLIVFGSYIIIEFSMKALGVEWKGGTNKITLFSSTRKL